MSAKEYLGDGCYVDFDGYGLRLTTENGISITNEVYLDPEVYNALVRYRNKVFSVATPSVSSEQGEK